MGLGDLDTGMVMTIGVRLDDLDTGMVMTIGVRLDDLESSTLVTICRHVITGYSKSRSPGQSPGRGLIREISNPALAAGAA